MLLEVETDKAVVEIEAQGDGMLGGVTAKVGDVVPVGQTIAWLLKPGEAVPRAATAAHPDRTDDGRAARRCGGCRGGRRRGRPPSAAGARISPKARKLAQEHGVDIATDQRIGPGRRDSRRRHPQVRRARHRRPPRPGPHLAAVTRLAPDADRASRPRHRRGQLHRPHHGRADDAELDDGAALLRDPRRRRDRAERARAQALVPAIEQSHGVKVTHTDLIVAAVARALRKHPRMNGSWSNGSVTLNPDVNVALAMAVENAVVTAVIRDADTPALGDIAKRRKELAERARANRLQPADITGATFTISNLGMFGVDAFTAIIVPPQAGILAVGAIADRVVAVDGMIGVRPMMTLTLSSDHRVVDGASAAGS